MKLALVGDMAFFGRFDCKTNSKLFSYFGGVKDYFSKFDYVVGNLEVPLLVGGARYGSKSAYICADPINVELIRYLGISAVNLANNHVYDFGRAGLDSTIKTLEEAGIEWFGVDGKDLVVEKHGVKVALHGYCSYNTNPLGADPKCARGVHAMNYQIIKDRAKLYSEQGCFNVISIHAGQEHVNYPGVDEIIFSRELARELNYVYYGHHPHVLQGVESFDGSVLAHSLGNFCFDDVYTEKSDKPLVKLSEDNKVGAALEVDITSTGVAGWRVLPFYLGCDAVEFSPPGVADKLSNYSMLPSRDFESYKCERDEMISSFIKSRKGMRDFKWYLARMKFSSVGIIFRAKYNALMHKKIFSNRVRHGSVE